MKTFEFRTVVTEWRVWKIDAKDQAEARTRFFESINFYDDDDKRKYSKLADCKSEIYSIVESESFEGKAISSLEG